MQFQKTPSIGSATLSYPLSAIIIREKSNYRFQTSAIPGQGQLVSNPVRNDLLHEAYHFIPGQTLKFEVLENSKTREIEWVVESDIYKNTSLVCKQTRSRAYFKQLGDVFYFTGFEGNKRCVLYYFYLSSFKLVTAFYKDMSITDAYPLSLYPGKFIRIVQDFCIPFFRFLDTRFELTYDTFSENGDDSEVILKSKAYLKNKKTENPDAAFTIIIGTKGIHQLEVSTGKKQLIAKRIY